MSNPGLTLARAHRFYAPIPDRLREDREAGVLIRYDAKLQAGEPVVFAVLSSEDLAKLPGNLFEELDFEGDDGRAPDAAFFVENPFSIQLYVDSDRGETFLSAMRTFCDAQGRPVLSAQGDLDLICDASGEINAPEQAAFEQNGYDRIPFRDALDAIAELRRGREAVSPEKDRDDTSLPSP